MSLRLRLLSDSYGWFSLPPRSAVDAAAFIDDEFWFISGDKTETTVACVDHRTLATETVSSGWRIFEVTGELPHHLTGIAASIAVPLADAGVQIMPIANYRTDYVGVNGDLLLEAISALQSAGFETVADESAIDALTAKGLFECVELLTALDEVS